jgi:hypothetical protein
LRVTDTILADLRGAATGSGLTTGALPLLSQAMLSTWEHRDGGEFTIAAYRRCGGIADAVQTSAEIVYQQRLRRPRRRGAAVGPGHRPPGRGAPDGHTDRVWRVAIAPDGTWLASVGADATVRVWDAATGECWAVMRLGGPRIHLRVHPGRAPHRVAGRRGLPNGDPPPVRPPRRDRAPHSAHT